MFVGGEVKANPRAPSAGVERKRLTFGAVHRVTSAEEPAGESKEGVEWGWGDSQEGGTGDRVFFFLPEVTLQVELGLRGFPERGPKSWDPSKAPKGGLGKNSGTLSG